MSSRRKSSTPCMVRVVSDPPDHEQDDPEEVMMDVEAPADDHATDEASPDSADRSVDPPPESSPENPDQQKNRSPEPDPEPSEPEEPSGEAERPAVIEEAGEEKERDGGEAEPAARRKQPRGYECKYCPFSTQNLNDFKEHVDASHPNVILNPLYLCAACDFNTKKFDSLTEHNERRHPGETRFKFKRIKTNNQTVLEQTIEGKDNSAESAAPSEPAEGAAIAAAAAVFPTAAAAKAPDGVPALFPGAELQGRLDGLIQKEPITAVSINGTVIIPEPAVLRALPHVTPMLQRPPNFSCVPKIAVPLNTTKYNPSLDDNLTLITSFNKFPYPTHAELSWLTAASKHPEEQIKVWFTTQRLKQGITWSPEEVEEARKKMFNGSIPPAHHTFTVLPAAAAAGAASQPSAKSSQQPLVHATVRHSGHARTAASNGLSVVTTTTTNSPAAIAAITAAAAAAVSGPSLKRTHVTTVFGPESKRPIMAVAPHSGDPKDKVLMAPPPPPPPQKDRLLPMAPPPVPMEMKRPVALPLVTAEVKRSPAAVPLMPSPPPSSSSSPSSSSKGKILPTTGNPKTKPVVSLPSIVFPESLTRPLIVPPPIFAPPFKNPLLFPLTSKEKHPNNALAVPAADMKLPTSPPLVTPQIRRPTIIQSVRAPARTPPHVPGFPADAKKLKEELKGGFARGDRALTPLAEANGTSRLDGKWHHDPTHLGHNNNNNGVVHGDADEPKLDFQQQKSAVLTQFPLLERMKGKTAEQLKILEENFLRNSFPTQSDVDHLAGATRLSHQEIDSWFVERRALRDNLEQALLNSMGTKRMGANAGAAKKRLLLHHHQHHHQHHQHQQHQTLQLNGIHKPGAGVGHLKGPLPPPHPLPIVAPGNAAPSIPTPTSGPAPPDAGRSLALLKDDFAQTRWPSPEELGPPDARAGPPRADQLARWFADGRLQSGGGGGVELTELFHNNGVNGGQGQAAGSPENAAPGILRHGPDGGGGGGGGKVLEVELGWLMEQRANSFSAHDELQERFAGRLRQQAELKNGGQNGGVGGGARDVFGSWLQDGHSRRDRDRKLAEDSTGRLTG